MSLFPNIRKLFIADPGYVICDADLAGADAQVVAWEADDEDLKAAFKAGLKVHHKNAADMWGREYTDLEPGDYKKDRLYKQIKSGVHGTNYAGSAKTLATTLGWTVAFATNFQHKWFKLHPKIGPRNNKGSWHHRIADTLERTRMVTNAFGFRRPYFDRIDSVFPEALAWGPQSTVAITCFKGAINVEDHLPWVQILLQNHDSLVFQIPRRRICDLPLVRRHLLNPVPYPDPLTIPWGISISARAWGDCREMSWEEATEFKP